MTTIRRAAAVEKDQLVALALQFLSLPPYCDFPLAHGTRETIGALVDLFESMGEKAAIFVAADEAVVVGLFAVIELPHVIAGIPYAEELIWFVEPTARGGLAGVRLLEAAEAWARTRGLTTIKMVAPYPSRVGRFYLKRGYRVLETTYVKSLT